MEKRAHLQMDDAYHDFSTPQGAAVYERESFRSNRADSIEWARRKAREDREIAEYLAVRRAELNTALRAAGDTVLCQMLRPQDDLNHYFVIVGDLAQGLRGAQQLVPIANRHCAELKQELNLDLMPALFRAERPHNQRPQRPPIRLSGANE
jgi:hypothetical protein